MKIAFETVTSDFKQRFTGGIMLRPEAVRESGYYELEAQLKKWWKLLTEFRSYNDQELEFDLKFGGKTSIEYLNTLSVLKLLTKKNGSQIMLSEKAAIGEGIKNSISLIMDINKQLERLLELRHELKNNGTKNLYKMCKIPAGNV